MCQSSAWSNVESELKQDCHLTRQAMNGLHRMLHREQDHDWWNEIKLLIYTYWLAHDYRTGWYHQCSMSPRRQSTPSYIGLPKTLGWNLPISFPTAGKLQIVGEGFISLAGTCIFKCCPGNRWKPHPHHITTASPAWLFKLQRFAFNKLASNIWCKGKVFLCTMPEFWNIAHFVELSIYSPGHILLIDGGYSCL